MINHLFKDSDLTAEELREVLSYDSETGIFTWRTKVRRSTVIGSVAGCIHYRRGSVEVLLGYRKRVYQLHRLAWLYVYGQWPRKVLDHINGDRADNRISNLRECTPGENVANQRVKKCSLTGTKGVRFDKERGLFYARIRVNGKREFLGRYATLNEAADAYKSAALTAHGEFARFK